MKKIFITVTALAMLATPALAAENNADQTAATSQSSNYAGKGQRWQCIVKDRVGFSYSGQWYDRAYAVERAFRECQERSQVTDCYLASCRQY